MALRRTSKHGFLPYDQAQYPFALNPYTRIKASNSVHVQDKRSRICWWCTWPARRASWSCLLTPKFARYRCTIATRRQRPPARPASPSRIHTAPGTPRRICVWPCRPSCTTATPTKPSSRTLWTGNTKAAATSKVIPRSCTLSFKTELKTFKPRDLSPSRDYQPRLHPPLSKVFGSPRYYRLFRSFQQNWKFQNETLRGFRLNWPSWVNFEKLIVEMIFLRTLEINWKLIANVIFSN